jgi:D-aminoacyl-tRNA deacylase
MKYAILISKKDPAGINIKNNLLKLSQFSKPNPDTYNYKNINIYLIEEESIYCEKKIKEAIIIFASKHQAISGKPSLSVHVPGNWSEAKYGGEKNSLNVAPASLMKELFLELNKYSKQFDGEITLEATHHGPTVQKPVLFIEIGSGLSEWTNETYGKIIAKTLLKVLDQEIKHYDTFLAIGGGHYPREFNKVLLRTNYAIANICPKYELEKLTKEKMKQALEKTTEKIVAVLVDWKGLGKDKDKVIKICQELDLKLIKVRKLLKNNKIL